MTNELTVALYAVIGALLNQLTGCGALSLLEGGG